MKSISITCLDILRLSDQNSLTVLELVHIIEERFDKANLFYGHGTSNPLDEAVYLVFTVLNLPFDCSEEAVQELVDSQQINTIDEICQQRIDSRKPMAYLLNEAWFCGLPFYVNENVLIPRSPIAELIEERFQPWLDINSVNNILDIGTGSGCIAIACAYAFEEAMVHAADISSAAIEVATRNINEHNLSHRMRAVESDLFSNIETKNYDLIVSNPPYVSDAEVAELPEEYHHEPVTGLRADDEGLSLVKQILRQAPDYLNDNGILIVEVGHSQQALIDALPEIPFFWFEFANGGEGVFMLNKEQLLSISV